MASVSAVASDVPLDLLESSTRASYEPPASLPHPKAVEWVHNPSDGSVLLFEYFFFATVGDRDGGGGICQRDGTLLLYTLDSADE